MLIRQDEQEVALARWRNLVLRKVGDKLGKIQGATTSVSPGVRAWPQNHIITPCAPYLQEITALGGPFQALQAEYSMCEDPSWAYIR